MLAIGLPIISLVVYFAQIGPSISEMKTVQIEQRLRVDRIEESRLGGLQRLAKVEEAITASKESLNQINSKLDRVLFERRK